MFEISNKLYLINKDFNYSLRVYFYTCLGIFFFILFFQPFVLNYRDLNNQLLYISGYSVITFISPVLFFIVLPWVLPRPLTPRKHETRIFVLVNSLAWLFCSTGFVFYMRYVGNIEMTMYLVFKVALLCLVPIVILAIIRENESLREQLQVLRENIVMLNLNVQETDLSEKILFITENKSDSIELHPEEILLIRSVDNYVEIVCLHEDGHKQKLIRSTLKSIEVQLKPYNEFLRCHRTCIVNTGYILKLNRNYSGYSIRMHGYEKPVPVSRQYLLAVREALDRP